MTIRFKAKVSGDDFVCGQNYANQGSTSATVTPSDFRFFVQNVRLISSSGADVPVQVDTRAPWQTPDVSLIDFEDGRGSCVNGNADTNVVITGTVPAGNYSGVAFVTGIPDALNHADPATAPAPLMNAPGSLWAWLAGYKFVIAELAQVASGDQIPGLGAVHVGSTACTGNPQAGTVTCARPNRNEIRLTSFDPATSVIVADIGVLFATTDLSQDSECHSSGSVCPDPFARLGINFSTGQPLSTQQVFHLE